MSDVWVKSQIWNLSNVKQDAYQSVPTFSALGYICDQSLSGIIILD